jgi:serine/threonine-protein kinase
VRFSSGITASATAIGSGAASSASGRRDRHGEPAHTLLIPEDQVAQAVHQAATASVAKLDINTLNPGEVIEGRYKYIERIGKGAFGTVLLMEDTVVDERLILKFLNPNVAEDEEVMSASSTSCAIRARSRTAT